MKIKIPCSSDSFYLNWYQKIIIRFQKWNNFEDNFPEIGDKVEIRFDFTNECHISEPFRWVIDDKEKEKWLNSGLNKTKWRISKKPDDMDMKRLIRKKKLEKLNKFFL